MSAFSVIETPPEPSQALPPIASAIAIRMADEGIPVLAIARATRLPSDEVYEVLRDAVMRGVIIELPKDDWPIGTTRTARNAFAGTPLEQDEELQIACARCFKATRLEAAVLAVLLKRNEVTKKQVHLVIEAIRPGDNRDPTDPKMVDVVICHLRKKLKLYDLEIETVWGIGYLIPPVHRTTAMNTLHAFIKSQSPLPQLEAA